MSRRETAVDESRKEIADRVAGHQADKEVEHDYTTINSATNWCSWFQRTWSSLVFSSFCFLFFLLFYFLFLALTLRDFHFISFSSFFYLPSRIEGVVWRGGWIRAYSACFVLSDARGLGIVDERSAETAVRIARYQAD